MDFGLDWVEADHLIAHPDFTRAGRPVLDAIDLEPLAGSHEPCCLILGAVECHDSAAYCCTQMRELDRRREWMVASRT